MSQIRSSAGVGSLLAVLVMVNAHPVWSADAAPATEAVKAEASGQVWQENARVAMEKGLRWLQSHQKDNGSWSDENYPGLTALGLWAASRSGNPSMTGVCQKAAAFVAGFAREDGGIYKPAAGGRGSGGLSTYNTALCMTALHAYDRDRYMPLILGAREYMAGSQIAGGSSGAGGFGYDRTPPPASDRREIERRMIERARREGKPAPSREEIAAGMARMEKMGREDRADLSNTGWALTAMRATQDVEDSRSGAQKKVDVDWSSAVAFVEKLQNRDMDEKDGYGGFGYELGGDRGGTTTNRAGVVKLRGFGSMTYAGIESMIHAQVDRRDPRVQSALQWAARHWSVDENPGMGARGLFYYFNMLAKCLSLTGSDVLEGEGGRSIPWRRELTDKLVSLQNADGSWANEDNTFWENDRALVTAYAVLTLQFAAGR